MRLCDHIICSFAEMLQGIFAYHIWLLFDGKMTMARDSQEARRVCSSEHVSRAPYNQGNVPIEEKASAVERAPTADTTIGRNFMMMILVKYLEHVLLDKG